MVKGRFHQEKHRENVRPKRPLKLFLGDLLDRILWMLLGRVIHHDVQPPELAQCLIDRPGTEFLVADVAVDKQTFATMLFDKLLGFFGVPVLFEVDNADVRALLGEGNCDSAADPAVTAGDDRGFAQQFAATALTFIFRLGMRLHFVLASRTLPLMLRRLTFLRLWHDEILSISMRLPAVLIFFCEKIRSTG